MWLQKDKKRDPCDDGNVLYLDCQCEFSGCDIVQQFCKMLSLGETG